MPGGGGGFMQDMITSLKNNRNNVKERRAKFNKIKDEYAGLHYKKNKLILKKAPKALLLKINKENEHYNKKYQLGIFLIIILIIATVVLGIILMQV